MTAEGAARKASSPSPSGREPRLHGQGEQLCGAKACHTTRLPLSLSQVAEFPAEHQGAGKNPTHSVMIETSSFCTCILSTPTWGWSPSPCSWASGKQTQGASIMPRKWGGTPIPPCHNFYVSFTGSVEGWWPLPSRLRWHYSPAFPPRFCHPSGDPCSPSSMHSHGLFEVKAFKKTTGWGQRKSALQDHQVERASSGSFQTSAIMQLARVAALPKERCDAHFSRNSKELEVFTWERDGAVLSSPSLSLHHGRLPQAQGAQLTLPPYHLV